MPYPVYCNSLLNSLPGSGVAPALIHCPPPYSLSHLIKILSLCPIKPSNGFPVLTKHIQTLYHGQVGLEGSAPFLSPRPQLLPLSPPVCYALDMLALIWCLRTYCVLSSGLLFFLLGICVLHTLAQTTLHSAHPFFIPHLKFHSFGSWSSISEVHRCPSWGQGSHNMYFFFKAPTMFVTS